MEYWTLSRIGREYYRVEISTEPALTEWEISFDQGATWHEMVLNTLTGFQSVLVNGPDFVPEVGDTTPSATITESVVPYVRAVDNPEVIVRTTPKIDLV